MNALFTFDGVRMPQQNKLPKFIEDYNLGDDIEDEMGGLGGFDNFLNTLGTALGVGPPPGGPLGGAHAPPPPPTNVGNAGNAGNTTANTAAAANGIVPTGNGGYATHLGNGVILGTGPLPPFLGPGPAGPPPPTAAAAAPPAQTNGSQQAGALPNDLIQQLFSHLLLYLYVALLQPQWTTVHLQHWPRFH